MPHKQIAQIIWGSLRVIPRITKYNMKFGIRIWNAIFFNVSGEGGIIVTLNLPAQVR